MHKIVIFLINKYHSKEIEDNQLESRQKNVPSHQMRKCFKMGMEQCSLAPPLMKNKIFIAMSFDNEYLDSYNFGIVRALNSLGLEYYRADSEKDIMCKICYQI